VKTLFDLDRSIVLTALAVAGMLQAVLSLWPLQARAPPVFPHLSACRWSI
jgi:hypothetical protein